MKTLTLKTETLAVLSSSDLDAVHGGLVVSSARPPVPGPVVSSVRPHPHRHHHGPVSSIRPTETAVSSVRPGHGPLSSVRPR